MAVGNRNDDRLPLSTCPVAGARLKSPNHSVRAIADLAAFRDGKLLLPIPFRHRRSACASVLRKKSRLEHFVRLSSEARKGVRDDVLRDAGIHGEEGHRAHAAGGFARYPAGDRRKDGCKSLELTVNQNNPDNMIIVMRWQSRGHYDTYRAWRETNGDVGRFAEATEADSRPAFST